MHGIALLRLLPTIGLLLLGACSSGAASGPPADFSLRYAWREGSLPPPYHYAYCITLAADGSGAMQLVPDYPGPDVPVWDVPFTLSAAEVAQLHAQLLAQDLVRERWQALDNPPVGGAAATLEVQYAGQTITIPAFPLERQQARAAAISAAIEAIVPQAIRDDLEQRRAAYVAAATRP